MEHDILKKAPAFFAKECLADRNLVQLMGKNARRYVEMKLSREKVLTDYCKFLDGDWEGIESDMSVS